MRSLDRVLDAMTVAAPFTIAEFRENIADCYAMSHAGAMVLRAEGFDAEVVPCVLHCRSATAWVAVGLRADEMAERSEREDIDVDPAAGADPHHAVIVVRDGATRAYVDLTFGQLRRFGVEVPLAIWFTCDDWPTLDVGAWQVWYEPSPRSESAMMHVATAARSQERTAVLSVLLSLALVSGDHFLAAMSQAMGPAYQQPLARVKRWLVLGDVG